MHDDRVIHRARFRQFVDKTSNRRVFLTDGNVNTNNILSFLVQDGINRYRGFTGTAVADNQLTLTASDRNHRVDGFNTGL